MAKYISNSSVKRRSKVRHTASANAISSPLKRFASEVAPTAKEIEQLQL